MPDELTTLWCWFLVKHFVCDFPLQATPWMYRNKGTYGHPGGLAHAMIHGVGTALVLGFSVGGTATLLAIADMIVHYHIDFAKMRIGARYQLTPVNSEWFWIVLGFDQLLHYLTYVGLVMLAVSGVK